MREIINRNYHMAKNILLEKKEALIRLAEALIVWETLDRTQIDRILAGEEIGIPLGTPLVKNDEPILQAT